MSTTTAPVEDIATIIERSKPHPPQTCHTVDHRGWALCGAFGPGGGRGDSHSPRECRARGHHLCVVCEELHRQLGDDRIVAA
jgi:hypothetical protein